MVLPWTNSQPVKPLSEDCKGLDENTNDSWVLCSLSGISEAAYVPSLTVLAQCIVRFFCITDNPQTQWLTANSIYFLVHGSEGWLWFNWWRPGLVWPCWIAGFYWGPVSSTCLIPGASLKGWGLPEGILFMPARAFKASFLLTSYWPKQVTRPNQTPFGQRNTLHPWGQALQSQMAKGLAKNSVELGMLIRSSTLRNSTVTKRHSGLMVSLLLTSDEALPSVSTRKFSELFTWYLLECLWKWPSVWGPLLDFNYIK